MGGRPEILYPLLGDVQAISGIGPRTARLLERMEITRPRDLLLTLPHSGIARHEVRTVRGQEAHRVLIVPVEVITHHPPPRRGRPWRVEVQDEAARFQLVFFHARESWLRMMLPEGARRVVSGKLEYFDGLAQIVHPDYIVPPEEAAEIPAFEPIYPLTEGLAGKTMRKAVAAALERVPPLPEWIDPALLAERGWPGFGEALRLAHQPKSAADLAPEAPARARLAYDELFSHQLTLALARAHMRRGKGRPSIGNGNLRRKVLETLPFSLTGAQERAIAEIAEDMAAPTRMSRLLQGDVGAGKTLVAFMALLIAVEAGGQGALMAPTEILARQHLATLAPLAEAAGVRLALLTGRDAGAERKARLAALAAGEIDIVIGTHALFQKDIAFADLRLAVIDEQHRFGVEQRLALAEKGAATDVLVMTATPIPRSLALARYGDMDLTVLDEKPPGRKPVRTALVSMERLDEVVAHLRRAIAEGRRAYWVCPLVSESELSDLSAAEARHEMLRAALGEGRVGLVHGQMGADERDAAMARFQSGEISVLVATTVIEVGVDVPEATIMIVERAENFGLSQLHQLRGRVGRGSGESSCLLLYQPPLGETARRRLEILRQTEDGFRIAEEDLAIRGSGDVIGTAQSGLPHFRIARIERQLGLMETARADARRLLQADPALESPRGAAARQLLWLMGRDHAIRLIHVG